MEIIVSQKTVRGIDANTVDGSVFFLRPSKTTKNLWTQEGFFVIHYAFW
jgi:hypothetical protein